MLIERLTPDSLVPTKAGSAHITDRELEFAQARNTDLFSAFPAGP